MATERAGADGVVAAVADGHGHSRHHRSARGSRLAVKIGCQVAQELADRLEGHNSLLSQRDSAATAEAAASEIAKLTEEFLVPAIVARWRDAVLADVKADPFTDAEQAHRHQGDDATIAYGSTLLLGMVLRDWLILAQIGDGDVVGVQADGRSVLPVPTDPQLDGLVTTSLCGLDPRRRLQGRGRRYGAQAAAGRAARHRRLRQRPGGRGVAGAFSEDLAWMLRDRDVHWLASQLPSWAARCASSDGSADDTTVALMISPTNAAAAPARAGQHGRRRGLGGDDHPGRPARRYRADPDSGPPSGHPAGGAGHAPAAGPPHRARAADHRAAQQHRAGRNRAADQRAGPARPWPGRRRADGPGPRRARLERRGQR